MPSRTLLSLVNEVLTEVHEPTLGSIPGSPSGLTRVKIDQINRAQEDVLSRRRYRWQQKTGVFQTKAVYSAGTVSVTNGDATVTGTGTAFSANVNAGDRFRVDGDDTSYVVSSITNDTSLELTTNYIGTTATGKSYSIFQREYSLASDVDEIMEMVHTKLPGASLILGGDSFPALKKMDIRDLEQSVPDLDANTSGIPSIYCEVRDSNGALQALFYPYPREVIQISYRYYKTLSELSSTNDTSGLHAKYHRLLYLKGLAAANRWLDDPYAEDAERLYESRLNTLVWEDARDYDGGIRVKPVGLRRKGRHLRGFSNILFDRT